MTVYSVLNTIKTISSFLSQNQNTSIRLSKQILYSTNNIKIHIRFQSTKTKLQKSMSKSDYIICIELFFYFLIGSQELPTKQK